MLGAILFNILLVGSGTFHASTSTNYEVLGSSFVVGGIRYHEQVFNTTVTLTMSSILTLASASLVLPTTFSAAVSQPSGNYENNILVLSHGTAAVLLLVYLMYLFFQLRTHADLFDTEAAEVGEEPSGETQEPQTLGPVAASLAIVILSTIVAPSSSSVASNQLLKPPRCRKTSSGSSLSRSSAI